MRILIVDDTALARALMKNMISKYDFEVYEAENGALAVEAYRMHNPDLVTMDITMPIMNGIEAVREIMKYDSNARIIMASAYAQEETVNEALQAGAKDFVTKPVVEEALHEAIEKVLNETLA